MKRPALTAANLSLASLFVVSLFGCGGGDEPRPPPATEPADPIVEMTALAGTEAVRAMNLPFGIAPAADQALYVAMSDGARLALGLFFPSGFDRTSSQAPVIYIDSWYGRADEVTMQAIDLYRAAGFVARSATRADSPPRSGPRRG